MPQTAWQLLGEYLRETTLLGSIQNTLYWDQNTIMPSSGAEWRGEQLSFLAKKLHARQTSEELCELLDNAKSEFSQDCLNAKLDSLTSRDRSRNIELLEEDLRRQQSLDPDLIVQLAKAKANGYMLWKEAKANNDFQCFAPALQNLISLRKEQAKQLDEPRSCWETLAQPYEPGLSIDRLKELFHPLRIKLPELIQKVSKNKKSDSQKWDLSIEAQKKLSDQLLTEWCRDKKKVAVAKSPHPFSITLGPNDFRITTRIVEGQPLSCFLATAHEWGHSLYEQGLPSECNQWFAWPLGQATSMAVHESQSLFWENRIARSLQFAKNYWKHFQKAGAAINCSDDLWHVMNPFVPGLNRVEADELSYGLHIMIRTDLEIALLEQDLPVRELPMQWNKRYEELLGVVPENDREGCLQDVHWSEGMFGYFPSYLLGHLISAQLSKTLEKEIGAIGSILETGNIKPLLKWLRENVHHYGRSLNAEELVKKVTGESLSTRYFIEYLETKLIYLIN